MRSPVRLRWIILAVVTVWIAGGIVFQSPRNGDVNPIEAAKPRHIADNNLELVLTAEGPSDMIGCLQNCWFSGSSQSMLVLYQDRSEPDGRYHFGLLGQFGNEWHRTAEQSFTLESPGDDGPSISMLNRQFDEGESWMYRWGITSDYVVSVGKVDSDNVRRVNLIYDTGEIVSPKLTGDYFVSFATAQAVCEAIVFDHAGNYVETHEADQYSSVSHHLGSRGSVTHLCN